MKEKILLLVKVAAAFCAFKLVSFISSEVLALCLMNGNVNREVLLQIYQAGSTVLIILVAFPVFLGVMRLFGINGQFSWKAKKKASPGKLLLYVLAALLPVLLLYGGMLIAGKCGVIPSENLVSAMSFTDVIREGILGCILMPIAEEIMFRGVILHSLKMEGRQFALIASTLLFAVGHRNPVNIILGMVTGYFFAYLALKHKGIGYGVICHVVVNVLGNIVMPLLLSVLL